MRIFPMQPFWGYFWALIALVVVGTVTPASCSRPAELQMESVAGVYSYFPQGSTILILFPDGRASISMREDATRISFFEKLASQSDEAPDEREQFSLEELEAEYGVEIERVLEDPS